MRMRWLTRGVAVGVFSLAVASACEAQYLNISTFAGTGSPGLSNGAALTARFSNPSGVAVDRVTNIYVADTFSNVIRWVMPGPSGKWNVGPLAGDPGVAGDVDGADATARFNGPMGVAADNFQTVFVADTGNNQIRMAALKLDGSWHVTTLAGTNTAEAGAADGTNGAALFDAPSGIALDPNGRLFVADRGNETIRILTRDITGTNWVTTTFAGSAGTPGFRDGLGGAALFSAPNSVAFDAATNLYVADGGNYAIRMITPQGKVTTIAGGQPGLADGVGTNAQFDFPCGIAVDAATNVYVSDFYNCTVRCLTRGALGWQVLTVAGSAPNPGRSDGVATFARFQFSNTRQTPNGLAVSAGGGLFIADSANCLIRTGTAFEGLMFLTSPQSLATVAGNDVTLTASAVGATPISYQWLSNGVAIAGATNGTLALTDLQTNGAGNYSVAISNQIGISNSPAALVTVELPLAVSTVAGVGAVGSADGFGLAARFNGLAGVAVDASGNVLAADSLNDTIRRITPQGLVSTVAGLAETPGNADGTNSGARFDSPTGVAVDTRGNVFVADTLNQTIREISGAGFVRTIAGVTNTAGFRDGPASLALFQNPSGVAVDESGTVYVADTLNHRVRAIANGYVRTLAGNGAPGAVDASGTNAEFNEPFAVAVDTQGNLFIADYGNSVIRKITRGGLVTTIAGMAGQPGYANGTNSAARFNLPSGIAVDSQENVWVADYGNEIVRRLTPGTNGIWTVTSPAGFPQVFGDSDGTALGARFHGPTGIAVDSLGGIYVGDSLNGVVRKVTSAGMVTTLAGPAHSFGLTDGAFPGGRLNGPQGVAADAGGNVYASDTVNNTIRQITPNGNMSTIAGLPGFGGVLDGEGSNARLSQPAGLAVDAATNIYVADFQNSLVRKMTFDASTGNWRVATLAGTPGAAGYRNGTATNAQFNGPWAVAADGAGNVYVSDSSNQVIRLITAAGVVTNYAGSPTHAGFGDGSNAFFDFPAGIALDGSGNLYVADSGNQLIRKIAPGGMVSTVAGTYFTPGSADGNGLAAQFNSPQGLAVDALGNIFIGDTGNNAIRQITPGGGVVTIAALAGVTGSRDGVGRGAQFDGLTAVALGPGGDLYIADTANNTIRVGAPYYGQALVLTPAFARAVAAGAPLTLTPTATGAPPVTYQWRNNSNAVAGQTNLVLALAATQPANSGNYQLVVSNVYGAAASAPAAVSVTQSPQIYAEPGDQAATEGSVVSFSVTAFGSAPMSYQWSFNGAAISGATNATLEIPDMEQADAGAYQVTVSNSFGSQSSLLGDLALGEAPEIVFGLLSITGECGSNVVLTIDVTGSEPLSYQWMSGSAPVALATLPSLSVSNLVDGQKQYFAVVVTNAFGVTTSLVTTVDVVDTIGPAVTILGAAATNVLVGGLFVDPGAVANDLCSGPAQVLTNGTVNTSAVGTYLITYRATDAHENSSTNTRTVNVVPAAPVIVAQPVSQTNYPGATQTFAVEATGAMPMTFQWMKNGVNLDDGGEISGATNETLTIGPLSAADAGSYAVTVSNADGVAMSSNGVLVVGAAGLPVALTGFNRDVVVESEATGGNTASYAQAFDPTYPTFCFYESGLNASNVYGSSPTNIGLAPGGTYVSAVDGATVFQLAPYTANNVLYLTVAEPTGSLSLTAPTNFNALSILAASADGGGTGSWTIQFVDGTSSPAFALNAPDWQGTSGGAVTHFGELYYGNYGKFYAYNLVNNFPSLYQTTVNLAQLGLAGKRVAAISFTRAPGANLVTGVFALSGTLGAAVPPLQLLGAARAGNGLEFSLHTAPGQTYTLEETTNVGSGAWLSYGNVLGTGATIQFQVALTNRQQYFRITEP